MLFAGEPVEAEAILRALHQGRVAVRGMFTQHPRHLAKLVKKHPCDLIIASLSAQVAAADVAAGYRDLVEQAGDAGADGEPPPLVVVFGPDQNAEDLVYLAVVGAGALVEAAAVPALVEAVRRLAMRLGLGNRLAGLEAENVALRQTLRGLVALVEQPVARLEQARIAEVNPAFARQFDAEDGSGLVDLPLLDLIAPADRDKVAPLFGTDLLEPVPVRPQPVTFLVRGEPRQFLLRVQTCGVGAPDCHWLVLTPAAPVARAEPPSASASSLPLPLTERGALRLHLSTLLETNRSVNRPFALVFALLPEYARWLAEAGDEAVEARMALLVSESARAAPQDAYCGRIADDAVAIIVEDVDRADRGGLRLRYAERLAITQPDGLPIKVGVVVAETGEYTVPRLLDAARADAARTMQPGEPDLRIDLDTLVVSEESARAARRPLPTSPAAKRAAAEALAEKARNEALLEAMRDPNSLEARIDRALNRNALGVMYQPIISLMGDSQEHYSVLLRLEDLNNLIISADDLIGAAARSGNLPAVDRWVIGKALGELARWRRLGQRFGLFLSLSAETIRQDDLLIFICDSLRERDARGGWVTFQVQEREVRANLERWVTLCQGLHKIACRVAINQFGHDPKPQELLDAGVPVDFVKFAPDFAAGLATDIDKQRRLFDLASLARAHGARTIVSGVEDAATLTVLWGNQVDYVQGYYVQKPAHTMEAPTE